MPEQLSATDRASMPLLTLITQQSLDEDYQHVAERRATEAPSAQPRRPHRIALVVVAAFGLLVTIAALQTSEQAGVNNASRDTLIAQVEAGRDTVTDLQEQIVSLREENVGLRDDLDRATAAEQAATARLTRLQTTTGFGPVTGPGVRVSVDDRPDGTEFVKDTDLRLLVNGLWQAGAEAITINGQRLTARSAIRNSGRTIRVDARSLSPPYVVLAIGNKNTLQADLMDTSSGLEFRDLVDSLGFPLTMDNEDQLSLPAAPERISRLHWAAELTPRPRPDERQQKETPP